MEDSAGTESDLYHSALDTLMNNMHIYSTPTLEPSHYNTSFRNHFNSADEDKFFTFCSTINQNTKSNNINKEEQWKKTKEPNDNKSPTKNFPETPKRSVAITRKQRLFEGTESTEELKRKIPTFLKKKQLVPQRILMKRAITRFECMEGKQDKMALSKKPVRTSLRV